MSFTRTESERLARLKGCTSGIYCRYGRPTGGITGPTGPAGYSFFTLGGNQGALTPGNGAILVVNTSGPTGTIAYSNILQAVGHTGAAAANSGNPLSFLQVDSDIVPSKTNVYSIGTSDKRFKAAYFGPDGINIGGVPIGSTGGTTIVMPSRVQIGNTVITVSGDTLVLPGTVRLGAMDGPILGATGPTGPSGTGGSGGNMDWINKHLLGPAPTIEFETPVYTSSEIYIGWKYPDQVKLSFVNVWVPAMFGFTSSVEFRANGAAARQAETIKSATINDIDAERYLDICGMRYIPGAIKKAITGIILTNEPANAVNPYVANAVWPSGASRSAYVYYHPNFENLDPTDPAKLLIRIAYTNLSTESVNEGSKTLDLFIAAGPPSAPRNMVGKTVNATTVDISFNHPEFVDAQNPDSKAVIEKYKISYSTTGSTRRYGGPIAYTSPINELNPSTLPYNKEHIMKYTFGALYPESKYTFEVRALNSASVQDGSSAFVDVSTGILAAPLNLNNLGFPTAQFYGPTIKRVRDGAIITRLVNAPLDGQVYTTAYTIPIHQQSTRGLPGAGLAVATANLVGGPTASITYGGFGETQPTDVSNGGIHIVVDKYRDKYTEQAQQGFYMYADQIVRIDISGNIQPRADPYRVVLTQANYDGVNPAPIFNVSTLSAADQAPYEFYYDTQKDSPVFVDVSFNINNSESIYVSGISSFKSSSYKVKSEIQNMGGYFYRSPFLLYSNSTGTIDANESSINTNITNHSGTNDLLPGTINIENTQIFSDFTLKPTLYTTSVDIKLTASNISRQLESSIYTLPMLIDMPSYNLVYNTLLYPLTIPSISSTTAQIIESVGCRVLCGQSRQNKGLITNLYVTDFENYNDAIYTREHHATSVVGTEELVMHRGKYRTAKSGIGYSDFRQLFNNTVNYTNLIGQYRYIVYKWNLSELTNNLYYTKLYFILYDIENMVIKNNLAYVEDTSGSELLKIYYRFVEEPNKIPSDYNSLTTVWADLNSRIDVLDSGTYVGPSDNSLSRGGLTGEVIELNTTTKTIKFGARVPFITNNNLTLYLRIGLPMYINTAFSYAKAQIQINTI